MIALFFRKNLIILDKIDLIIFSLESYIFKYFKKYYTLSEKKILLDEFVNYLIDI